MKKFGIDKLYHYIDWTKKHLESIMLTKMVYLLHLEQNQFIDEDYNYCEMIIVSMIARKTSDPTIKVAIENGVFTSF